MFRFSNATYQYHYARLFCYLQAHRLLQLGGAGGAGGGAEAAREDSDNASGCSNEGSNTDSGARSLRGWRAPEDLVAAQR